MSTEIVAAADLIADAVSEAVREGLGAPRKTLPAWLFYDERGSQLFEQITELPEYYLTRTERGILAKYAPTLPGRMAAKVTVTELGAGTATKTGVVLKEFVAFQQRGAAKAPGRAATVLYQPIDISPSALEEAATLLAEHVPGVRVEPQVANYITETYSIQRPPEHGILALYIGSSIGNFSPAEATSILRKLRTHLRAGDSLLLGVDLAPGKKKPVAMLLAAYDDAAGVTAAFNRNVLVRLNRELGADFALEQFAHRARWNAEASRMEMHLESLVEQTVRIGPETFRFERGETIHTENSYKFTDEALASLLEGSGFHIDATMKDDEERFAVVLAGAV